MRRSVFGNFNRKRIGCLIGVLILAAAVGNIVSVFREYQEENRFYDSLGERTVSRILQSMAEKVESGTESGTEEFKTADAGSLPPDTSNGDWMPDVDFSVLKQVNPDIVGWILFDDASISYPLLQGRDNQEYLDRLADGSRNPAGSIFVDAECSADFTDFHTIVYGHNMRDGSMFGALKQYRTREEFFQKNRYVTVVTPKKYLRYEVFSWYEASEDDEVYQIGFQPDEQFDNFVRQMINRRERDTGTGADGADKILTLSTCSSLKKRMIVHAKLTAAVQREKNVL